MSTVKHLGWRAIRGGMERLPAAVAAQALTRLLPRAFVIEPTNRCNYACPLCPNDAQPRPRGSLRLADFRRLADEIAPFANHVALNLLGESFLNPDVLAMARHAERNGTTCSINTNGELLERHVEEVLDSGLSMIKVAVDGADRATHERYRIGSDFERVRRGVERLCAERRRRGARRPHVTVLNLVFRFNQHQQVDLRRWAEGVGVDRVGFKPVWLGLEPSAELAREYLPTDSAFLHDAYGGVELARDRHVCPGTYEAVVLWNGDAVACSRCAFDGGESYGNVIRDGFRNVWHSARHRDLLLRVLRGESAVCAGCDTPCQGKWLEV